MGQVIAIAIRLANPVKVYKKRLSNRSCNEGGNELTSEDLAALNRLEEFETCGFLPQ